MSVIRGNLPPNSIQTVIECDQTLSIADNDFSAAITNMFKKKKKHRKPCQRIKGKYENNKSANRDLKKEKEITKNNRFF